MARIRSIKPEFWKSEAIACHDFFTRLVFIGLWTYVDDNGVGLDNHRLIAAELFPLEEDFAAVSRDLRESLAKLADAGRLRRYTVNGKSYLAIVNWREHQKIDRPGKARYPEPDDPRATPNPPPNSPNPPPHSPIDEPSRECRESVAQPQPPDQGSGSRGEGDQGTTPPLASLDGVGEDDAVEGEIVDPPTTALALVPDAEPENAGHITKQWIDHCTTNQVKLTGRVIKQYAAGIKRALDEGFGPDLTKRALAQMLADRVASRPSLLDNYLIRAQQGPELPPRRMSRAEESAARLTPDGTAPGQHLYDILTRPA